MDKALILAELQALIDRLYIEGYTATLARLTVSKSGETFDAVLKGTPPSREAQDAKAKRIAAEDNGLPF
jgi:hypothetical protein